jgi:ceramide glucosyltransferase
VLVRAAAAWATASWVLHDPLTARRWWLLPLQDFASFVLWLAGFFGNTVSWRGRRYVIFRDGRFAPAQAPVRARNARPESPQTPTDPAQSRR